MNIKLHIKHEHYKVFKMGKIAEYSGDDEGNDSEFRPRITEEERNFRFFWLHD
jgi:hypothetical protein